MYALHLQIKRQKNKKTIQSNRLYSVAFFEDFQFHCKLEVWFLVTVTASVQTCSKYYQYYWLFVNFLPNVPVTSLNLLFPKNLLEVRLAMTIIY